MINIPAGEEKEPAFFNEEEALKNDEVKYGIKNVKPKTASGVRRLLLDSTVIEALEKLKERDKDIGSEYVICTQSGKQVFKGEINKYFHKMIDRIGIEKQGNCGPHFLRHTFATRMIAKGLSPQTLAVYLGHSTDQITRKFYVHDKQLIAESELKSSGLFE